MERRKLCIFAISGNEEKWVKQWCESVMKATPDLVVVNLTQYGDNSEQLFRENIPSDKLVLVKFPWAKSFSEARNHALDQIPDWVDVVMFLDLDEIFTEASYEEINKILTTEQFPHSLIVCTIYNTLEQAGMCASLFYPRGWFHKDKNGSLVNERFDGTVHNQLIIDNEKHDLVIIRTAVSILHYGYALSKEEMSKKHERSEELLRDQIKEDPEGFFPRLNLAQLLRAKGDHIGTEEQAREVIRIVTPKIQAGDERFLHAALMSSEQLSTSLFSQGKFDEAIYWADYGLNIKPDYLDAIMNKANSYMEKREFGNAKFWYNRYLFVRSRYDESRDNTNLILNHLNSSFIVLYNLGMIAGIENDIENAVIYFKKSYDEAPEFRDCFIKYIHSLRLLERFDEMNRAVNKHMQQHPQTGYMVYSYFGDAELDRCNIESAKLNMYQASFLVPETSQDAIIIKSRWESIKEVFGDVSTSFFETEGKSKKLQEIIS